jgi:uncharacterized protein
MDEKNKQKILQLAGRVREQTEEEGTGHDWWHIYRVWQMSRRIAEKEDVDMLVVEAGALTHDLADHKLTEPKEGLRQIRSLLADLDFPKASIEKVLEISRHVSFKGSGVAETMTLREGWVVQDADRLDAIGAIGIARAFAYGGSKGRLLYHPGISPEAHDSFAAYKNSKTPTINHFYEKLLLLKDRLHTETAREIAAARHQYMQQFLKRFYAEWEGKA